MRPHYGRALRVTLRFKQASILAADGVGLASRKIKRHPSIRSRYGPALRMTM